MKTSKDSQVNRYTGLQVNIREVYLVAYNGRALQVRTGL